MAFNDLDDNYSFLNDYLDKVTQDSDKVDPDSSMEQDNDFYNTQPDESEESDEGIQYGIDDEETSDESDNSQEEQNSGDENVLDYLLGNSNPYEATYTGEGDISNYGNMTVAKKGDSLAAKISGKESGGDYGAVNNNGGGAGAVGKYQFRWNIWKDSIKTVTGIDTKEKFQHSPQAQEKYFAWYEKNYLKPVADTLQSVNKKGLNEDQLMQLVHFRGEKGAKQYLLGEVGDKPESYNMPTSKYIAQHQAGGSVATAYTPQQQYRGLNDSSFSEMIFPMSGENTFRGLDSGDPVYMEDEEGNSDILRGNKHTKKFKGQVYEKKI